MIWTITSQARSLLLDTKLPAEFWAASVQTAAYLDAHSPSHANKGIIPYKILHNEKPELHHLQRFGCLAYRLVPMP
ncbi:hypothetical protein HOY80DRAFT_896912 [Tuber brumale]|nr:hypothetical protein HOY80DRAFT_896912 [Tuber brumale]